MNAADEQADAERVRTIPKLLSLPRLLDVPLLLRLGPHTHGWAPA